MREPDSHPKRDVIPAPAGIHAEDHPGTGCARLTTDLDSGLRRNDTVSGTELGKGRNQTAKNMIPTLLFSPGTT
ncbi:hypothetical protein GCM10007913_24050 [Devosia yakushimensis]|uniref:Uncharacterized protein n=1 Tax=Devosia yakushimensis TaxID=470028 RepID=A0ABQ5UGZ1_9HYPH|nr:hypothetical protein GCM10007913_24050 [Devosia yakushimensis]